MLDVARGGHSTLAMVKRYQHVLLGLTIAAAERMEKVMGRWAVHHF